MILDSAWPKGVRSWIRLGSGGNGGGSRWASQSEMAVPMAAGSSGLLPVNAVDETDCRSATVACPLATTAFSALSLVRNCISGQAAGFTLEVLFRYTPHGDPIVQWPPVFGGHGTTA